MPTARQIITSALTYHLNRLSPGEVLDADLGSLCLGALNDIVDEWNGSVSLLWQTTLSAAVVTGTTGTLGTTWTDISSGHDVLGATYNNGSGDFLIAQLTMAQYHEEVRIKTLATGFPRYWAQDGASTIYFYPAPTGQSITLRSRRSMSDFADLDTVYVMPQGYRAALAAVLAEKMGPSVVGAIPPSVAKAAASARNNLMSNAVDPAIIGSVGMSGNIMSGWR